jgi:hypothetical protein
MDLITGLIVAVVVGVGVLAYRHPEWYRKIYKGIMIALTLAYIAMGAWDLGGTSTFYAMIPYIDKERMAEAEKFSASRDAFVPKLIAGYIGGMFYLAFLRFLPSIVGKTRPP